MHYETNDEGRTRNVSLPSRLEKEVLLWRDRYVTRVDRDMTLAFPQLEKELSGALEANLANVLLKKPKDFSETVVQPAIDAWIKRITQPIREDAARDLADVALKYKPPSYGDFDVSRLQDMLLPAGVTALGVTLMIGGYLLGITTTWLIVTTVSWPILAGGGIAGTLLVATGVLKLSRIKGGIAKSFARTFIPKVRSCLIGDGYDVDGQHHDSVRRQFQIAIEKAASTLLATSQGN